MNGVMLTVGRLARGLCLKPDFHSVKRMTHESDNHSSYRKARHVKYIHQSHGDQLHIGNLL